MKWVHSPEGVMVPDMPWFLLEGTTVKITNERYVREYVARVLRADMVAYVDADCVKNTLAYFGYSLPDMDSDKLKKDVAEQFGNVYVKFEDLMMKMVLCRPSALTPIPYKGYVAA